ncbi:hypothetical protein L9F63_020056 [Diploptera punctata]|uniref:Myb-binding protein 1A n=1 Tax=Diploptera punctata TaxID=6984 RepID=A0AAD7ZTC7_DIPPU|nr:hypothetical protein L9F63_020056 [Diploptera punctata]
MEASSEHMLQVHGSKKMDSTVLDCFTVLGNNNEKSRIDAGVKLLEHVFVKQADFEGGDLCSELQYTLKRLICGVASSRVTARKGFFTALVGFAFFFSIYISKGCSRNSKKELHATNVSKSVTDIYAGHIFVYGALIRSGLLLKGSAEDMTLVFNGLLETGAKRSYLVFPAHIFLITLLEKIEKESFHDTIWPLLKNSVKPLAEESLEMLHFLLIGRSKFPEVVKKKFLTNNVGSPEIIHENFADLCQTSNGNTVRTASDFNHPVHEEFCKQLVKYPLLRAFWEQGIEVQLEKPSESKKIIAIEMFYYILKHLEDKSQVPHLLTPRFVDMVLKSLEKLWRKLVSKNDRVCSRVHEVFVNYMITTTLKEGKIKDKTILKTVKKLCFDAGGDVMFDRESGTKVVANLMGMLKESGVKKMAEMFGDVITGMSGKKGGLDGEEPRAWNNKEKIYAADVFARLLGQPAVIGEMEWKTEQLKFLLNKGLFYSAMNEQGEAPVGGLLADALKQTFFRALNQRMPKMENVRTVLNALVKHVNKIIEAGKHLLRQPLASEVMTSWQKLVATSESLERKIEKGKNVMLARVFHTMFLYMGLQLLADPKLADDALAELYSCYERAEKERKEKKLEKKEERSEIGVEEENEPQWVEVAVDLILSLLSQSSKIPRNMLDMFFFHLSPHLTGPALGQIIQVLDPAAQDSPLSNSLNEEDEMSDDDDDDNENSGEDSGEESDSSEVSDVEGEEEETVNDKFRMDIQQALGSAATQTDTESVDIDEMDEEEGKKLDAALSLAFKKYKATKPNKNTKKQVKDDRILMHFRIRAVDLLEIYLKSEHAGTEASLGSYIDIMLVLFSLLEFCIRDSHQKPLENKVRFDASRLSSARKNVSLQGETEETIANALRSLMEMGEKTTGPVFLDMGHKVVECCTFLVKCSQKLPVRTEDNSPIIEIYRNALVNFFTKRDCLHQQNLFKSVLEIVWEGNWTLVPLLIHFAFDPEIRPFRRNQALYLLTIFFRNRRIRNIPDLAQIAELKLKDIETSLSQSAIKFLELQVADGSRKPGRQVKQKFMHELFVLFVTIWHSYGEGKKGGNSIDWSTFGKVLVSYREKFDLTAEAKTSFNKLARVLNVTWTSIPKDKKQEVKDKFNDLENSGENENMEVSSDEEEEMEDQDNEEEETGTTKKSKKNKKKEKPRKKPENKAKLKKRSRELRFDSLSKGLEDVTFSGLDGNVEVGMEGGSDSESEVPNGLVNGKKHEKLHKRKSDVSVDNERTHKKKK